MLRTLGSHGSITMCYQKHESMDPVFLVSAVQDGGGGEGCGECFSTHSVQYCKPNSILILADHDCPLMATISPSYNDYSSIMMHHATEQLLWQTSP